MSLQPNRAFPIFNDTRNTLITWRAALQNTHLKTHLRDVKISNPASNNVLLFDASGNVWRNKTLAEAGIAASSHVHATADVTTGTFADARIAESNVTQHAAALSITESQISDLQTYTTVQNNIKNYHKYILTTGSAGAYTVTLPTAPSAYANGMRLNLKIHAGNTTSSTINVNSLGAKNVYLRTGFVLVGGELGYLRPVTVEYDTALNGGAGGWYLIDYSAVWTAWTPTLGISAGTWTNITVNLAEYLIDEDLIWLRIRQLGITNNGTAKYFTITWPPTVTVLVRQHVGCGIHMSAPDLAYSGTVYPDSTSKLVCTKYDLGTISAGGNRGVSLMAAFKRSA